MKSTIVERKVKHGWLLCESVSKGMLPEQKRIIEGVYKEFIPLFEMDLGNDKLRVLFNNVEQKLTDAGENKTKLGSAKSAIKAIDELINKAGKWLQDTVPVKMFDSKFKELKKKLIDKLGEDSRLVKLTDKMGSYASKNPGKTAFVIGVLTALVSLAGSPMSGAVVAYISKGIIELMKGEKLSSAVGKGFKSAAVGYITGSTLQSLGEWISGLHIKEITKDIYTTITFSGSETIDKDGFEWTRKFERVKITVLPEDKKYIESLIASVNNNEPDAFDKLYKMADIIVSSDYKEKLYAYKDVLINNNKAHNAIIAAKNALSALAQGTATGLTSNEKKTESILTIRQLQKIFEGCENCVLVENRFKTFAKNLTRKYTADKMYKAWIKARKPRDTIDVFDFLKGLGINEKIIREVYKELSLIAPKKKIIPIASSDIDEELKSMDADRLKELLATVDDKLNSMIIAKTKKAEKEKV